MRGSNANQLIEGIHLGGSAGQQTVGSDFNRTLPGTEGLASAIHEANQKNSNGEVDGRDHGIDSQKSLEDLLIGHNAVIDQNMRSLNPKDTEGDPDFSTLNPIEVASPMFNENDQHFEPLNVQNVHVIKKNASGDFESIEQSARILNVGSGTIQEQDEMLDEETGTKLRAVSASIERN